MTPVGISLGDALAYRRPTGSGIWDLPPGERAVTDPEARERLTAAIEEHCGLDAAELVNDAEGGEGND